VVLFRVDWPQARGIILNEADSIKYTASIHR